MLTWQRRLAEARIEAGEPRAAVVQVYVDAVNDVMNRAKEQAKVGQKTPIDVLDAEYRRIEASKLLETPTASAPHQPLMGGGMGGGMGAMGGGMGGGAESGRRLRR